MKCCNEAPKWVENVVGKGYFFCEVCRNEVYEGDPASFEMDNLLKRWNEEYDGVTPLFSVSHSDIHQDQDGTGD